MVADNRGARAAEAAKAEAIVDAAVDAFWRWFAGLDVVPTIVALRERAEDIRQREIARHLRALGPLDARQREALEHLTSAIVNKLLHAPVSTLRRHQGDAGEGSYIEAARRLFRIGDDADDAEED